MKLVDAPIWDSRELFGELCGMDDHVAVAINVVPAG